MGLQGKPMTIPRKIGPIHMKPKDVFYKVGTGIHRAIFNVSKGRIFGKAFGMPLVELVTIAGSTRTMITRDATEEERIELWPRITSAFEGYARYQNRTDRQIPVVIL